MQVIKIKYEILLSGFPGIDKTFQFHEFTLKSEKINEEKLIELTQSKDFNTGLFISYCLLTDEQGSAFYNYFENEEFIELEISNKCILKQEKIPSLCQKYPSIINKATNLFPELRIIFNVPVTTPVIKISFYNSEEEYIGQLVHINSVSFWNRMSLIDPDEFANNSRFHINLEHFKMIANDRYKRAMDFYDDSFESGKVETRFTMLISALESLFNYRLTSNDSITKKVSSSCANLLSIFTPEKYEENYIKIKKIYNIRSRYLHGDKNTITLKDEKELRKIVRIILIFYSIVINEKNYTIQEMLDYVNNPSAIELQHKLLLRGLFATSFEEQQLSILKTIEDELGNIVPPEFKKRMIESVKRND